MRGNGPGASVRVDVREGEVHQHRFAPPDTAPQIDSGRARWRIANRRERSRTAPAVLAASRSSAATARAWAGSGFSSWAAISSS